MVLSPYFMNYSSHIIDIRQTDEFSKWVPKLNDRAAKARIDTRIRRMKLGNFDDIKPAGEDVSETYGPGYRLYYILQGNTVVVLLCGGDKSTQSADIARKAANFQITSEPRQLILYAERNFRAITRT